VNIWSAAARPPTAAAFNGHALPTGRQQASRFRCSGLIMSTRSTTIPNRPSCGSQTWANDYAATSTEEISELSIAARAFPSAGRVPRLKLAAGARNSCDEYLPEFADLLRLRRAIGTLLSEGPRGVRISLAPGGIRATRKLARHDRPGSCLVGLNEIRPNGFLCSSCRRGCQCYRFCPPIWHSYASPDETTGSHACISSFHTKLAGNRLGAQKPE